ncbi:MAG TPA: O-antigen ligase family protein [Pyrinomonadaceae bacterium]|nr:O-antigen ligase family protein [Pyrinomonadaceae bacterium]
MRRQRVSTELFFHAGAPGDTTRHAPLLRLAEATAFCGLLLYAVFAPHSIAGAWIALSVSIAGWLARTVIRRRANLRRTPLDLPLWLFYAWSILSALVSAEPRISLLKLISVSTFLIFYLVGSLTNARRAALVATLMIASGAAGALWSAFEVVRGRGLVVDEIAPDSPLRAPPFGVAAGDAIWRVNGRRVNSVAEIDQAMRDTPAGEPLELSLFSRGEQVERAGALVPTGTQSSAQPSGLRGTRRSHRFRASGWTRHYQTFAETLQILAQLALGFALAHWQRRRTATAAARPRLRFALYVAAFLLLAAGITLTAMRTALVAFAVGAGLVVWRAQGSVRARLVVSAVVAVAVALGAFAVWRTRAEGALRLQDDSSRLRLAVARVALARIPSRPVFGHGMDAVKQHWTEWGFPGDVQIHTHSTPIQLAFDRGLPALLLWLWLLAAFWLTLARGERHFRSAPGDADAHGLLLGATGALAGFFASSLVNYNFGDAEVALVLWWLMGTVVCIVDQKRLANE